ncbi:DUF4870 domain-containing protein [Arcanobacterium haemolyticum]|nr:DUF4870 domain-containing protein [Arcanobacterium haemolyticum]
MSINGSDNTSGSAWSNNPGWSADSSYGSTNYGASYAQPDPSQGYEAPYGSQTYAYGYDGGYGAYPGQGYDQAYGEPRPGQGQIAPDDERTFAIIAHLSGIAGMIVSAGWLGFVGPLVVWGLYKDRSPYVREAAARSFNFYLGMTIASIVAWVCVFTIILVPVAIVIFIVAGIMSIVCPILAAIAASKYELGDYPFQIRVLK